MVLTLAVETSSRRYGVAVSDGASILAESTVDRGAPAFVDVGMLAASVLDHAGVALADLGRLAVDVGPGNLTSVRAGLAYVNALAFARDLPVVALDALGLLTTQVLAAGWASPALAVRPAGASAVYARLDAADGSRPPRHGPAAEVLVQLCDGEQRVSACGNARSRTGALEAAGVHVDDTGVDEPHVSALVAVLHRGAHGPEVGQVAPLTEGSSLFGSP